MGAMSEEELRQLAAALARLQSASAGSGLLPFLLGCFLATACLVVGYLFWQHRLKHRERLLSAAEVASADADRLRRLLGDVLPAWVSCPDSSRVEWMNAVSDQLWPFVERAARKFLLADGFLEGLINNTTFWRPRVLHGATFQLQGVTLGQVPPKVTGMKAFPSPTGAHNEVMMECSFVWASKMEAKLLVTMMGKQQSSMSGWRSVLTSAARIKVGVSDLVARGNLRISLKPLLDELPVAGGVKVSFMGTPEFSYETHVLGGNPYLLPGLQLWVDSFIRDSVLKPFTYPDGFVYNLATRSVPPYEPPEGLLEVTVVEAEGVPRMDLLGKADPYVQLWVRESRKMETTIKSRTLNPRWGESFKFLVHSSQHQELTLLLFDSDLWRTDDLVGRVSLPLSSLDLVPGCVNDLWLEVPRSGKRKYGHDRSNDRGDDGSNSSGGNRGRRGSRDSVRRQRVVPDSVPASTTGSSARTAAAPVPAGAAGPAVEPATVAAREDTAAALAGSSSWQQAGARPGLGLAPGPGPPPSAAAAEAAAPAAAQLAGMQAAEAEAAQPSAHGVSKAAVKKQLLDLLSFDKPCRLHITATYFPLTEAEAAAVAREANRQHSGEGGGMRSSSFLSSGRLSEMLHSGVLYVYLDRANNLVSKAQQGFTRNMKVKVRVGNIKRTTERGRLSFRHRSNPVFEESLDMIVDGETAQQEGALITVEIWVQHYILKDTFKGRVSIPLAHIIERRRVRDTWPVQGAPHGTITMELSWMGALAM